MKKKKELNTEEINELILYETNCRDCWVHFDRYDEHGVETFGKICDLTQLFERYDYEDYDEMYRLKYKYGKRLLRTIDFQRRAFMKEKRDKYYKKFCKARSPYFDVNHDRSTEVFYLSIRSQNCLKSADILKISQLVSKTETEMLKIKNFGLKSLNEIKEELDEMGLSLGMKLEGFVPSEQDIAFEILFPNDTPCSDCIYK